MNEHDVPQQLTLLPSSNVPIQFRIDADTRELEDCRWFDRAETADLLSRRAGEGGPCSPPPGAIAHHLIRHWVDNG